MVLCSHILCIKLICIYLYLYPSYMYISLYASPMYICIHLLCIYFYPSSLYLCILCIYVSNPNSAGIQTRVYWCKPILDIADDQRLVVGWLKWLRKTFINGSLICSTCSCSCKFSHWMKQYSKVGTHVEIKLFVH